MTPPPTGRQYELTYGRQRAVIVEMGAGLRAYSAGLDDVVDGYGIEEQCEGGRGQLLIPWPNRIADAAYRFDATELRLPVSEPRTGSAIHGLTRGMPWHLVEASERHVTQSLHLLPQDGYPFTLALVASYALGRSGLSVRITATNRGDRACPYGSGAHPYVRVTSTGLINDALLHVPAGATLEADQRGIPTGVALRVDGTGLDFRSPRRIGALMLDTAYTDFQTGSDGTSRVVLATPDGDRGVAVWMDGSHPFAMIYRGDTLSDVSRRRRGLAIEPMTCAPDAFNTGAGLIVLEPGQEHVSTWGITPLS